MSMLDYHELSQKFILEEVLGRGQFGMVRACRDRADKRKRYAYKLATLNLQGQAEPNWREILTEVDLLLKLDHPCIVKLFYYLFYERKNLLQRTIEVGIIIDRGIMTLHDYITYEKKKRLHLRVDELETFIVQAIHMMSYMHSLSIVHRDIKPTNIILTSLDPLHFKLIDFGLGAQLGENELCQGVFVGTYVYASPEMKRNFNDRARGIKSTHAVNYFKNDVYSMGQTLLELASLSDESEMFSIEHKLGKVRQFYGPNSYVYLAIEAMIEAMESPRPFASDLLTKSQSYFSNLNNDEEKAGEIQGLSQGEGTGEGNGGLQQFDALNEVSQSGVIHQVVENNAVEQIHYIPPQVTLSKTNSGLAQTTPSLRNQPTLSKLSPSKSPKRHKKPLRYRYSQKPISYDFGIEATCSKGYEDLILIGMRNGDLGVIFNNKHYLLQRSTPSPSKVSKKGTNEITCIQIKDDVVWTSSTNCKFVLWRVREIRELLKKQSEAPAKNRFRSRGLPMVIKTSICYDGPDVEYVERGISTFMFIKTLLVIGYVWGYLEIRNESHQLMKAKAFSNPITCLKHKGNSLYSVCSRGILKQINLQTMTVGKLYVPSSLDKRIVDIHLQQTQILAVTEKGLTTINYNLQVQDHQQVSSEQQILLTSQLGERKLCLTSTGRIFIDEIKVSRVEYWKDVSCVSLEERGIVLGTHQGVVHLIQPLEDA